MNLYFQLHTVQDQIIVLNFQIIYASLNITSLNLQNKIIMGAQQSQGNGGVTSPVQNQVVQQAVAQQPQKIEQQQLGILPQGQNQNPPAGANQNPQMTQYQQPNAGNINPGQGQPQQQYGQVTPIKLPDQQYQQQQNTGAAQTGMISPMAARGLAAGPRDTRIRQDLFRENEQGFTMHEAGGGAEEWEEEEEYEDSQQMFNSGFRSVLRNNQSINTPGGEANSQPAGAATDLQDAIQDFKKRPRQQSQVFNKENTKLPKMSTMVGGAGQPSQPAQQQQQAKPQMIQQEPTNMKSGGGMFNDAGNFMGNSYQQVKQIEEDSVFPQTKTGTQQQRVATNSKFNSVRPGLVSETQMNPTMYMSKETDPRTMQHGFMTTNNNDLPTLEQQPTPMAAGEPEEPYDNPYTLGEPSFKPPPSMGMHQRQPSAGIASRLANNEKNLSLTKFNEISAPPRMQPQQLWPDAPQGNPGERPSQVDSAQQQYLRQSRQVSVQQVSQRQQQERESLQLMSRAIKDQQINDQSSHYARDFRGLSPKAKQSPFPAFEEGGSDIPDNMSQRTQSKHLLKQVKHELDSQNRQYSQGQLSSKPHTPITIPQQQDPKAFQPMLQTPDNADYREYYDKQKAIQEGNQQYIPVHIRKSRELAEKSASKSKPIAPVDDLDQSQVFKQMRDKYDQDLLSNAGNTIREQPTFNKRSSQTPAPQRSQPRNNINDQAPYIMINNNNASNSQDDADATYGGVNLKTPYAGGRGGSRGSGKQQPVEDTTPLNLQQKDQDYSRRLNQYAALEQSQDSSKYQQFPGLNSNTPGLQKQFGVYTFEDQRPIIEKKARLIERLVAKKEPGMVQLDGSEANNQNAEPSVAHSKYKVRSIPGGIGHQIVFSSKSEREQAQARERELYLKQQQEMLGLQQYSQPGEHNVKSKQSMPLKSLEQSGLTPVVPERMAASRGEARIPGIQDKAERPFTEMQQGLTQVPHSLPRRLPKYEELQKQKFEIQNRRTEQIMANQKIQVEDFRVILWGYLSCADRLELQKLFKLSSENLVVRDFRELWFNQPFPYTQAKASRLLSSLYVAVATGCLENLNLLFDEMTWINVEHGIEIRKKFKDESEELLLQKGEKPVRTRTPLQLACALGLYKIVEILLSKGANPDGQHGNDVTGHTDYFYPPIVLCASRKIRQQMLDELVGISIWQVYDNNYEVSHVQCLEALLRAKANANLDLTLFSPFKPFPVFYCLKQRNFVGKLVQYGGDVNVQDREGLTPLCRVIDKSAKTANELGYGISEIEEATQLEIVDTLVTLGKAKTVFCCKLNPVLAAIRRGKYVVARYLAVKGGADVNWRAPGQPSAVQIAVDQDNVMLLEEVLSWPNLQEPLDLDFVEQETGTNIFHRIAKRSNCLELFQKLSASGKLSTHPQLLLAALNSPVAGQGLETLPLLMCCPNLDLAKLYLENGAGVHGLTFRQCYDRYAATEAKFLEFLIQESGALDINEADPVTGLTCLMTAAEDGDLKKMHFLLRLGADPDCRFPEDAEQRLGMTLLHDACLKGKVDIAKVLLQFGANFNLKCHRGRTTLDFLRTGHEQKSNRRREELKSLLYKYTVKNNIFNK